MGRRRAPHQAAGSAGAVSICISSMLALLAHFVIPAERLRWLSTAGVLVGFAGVAVIFSDELVGLQGREYSG